MWKILLICSLRLFNAEDEHAIYISVVEIEHKEITSSEIRVKVFKDDLRDVIKNNEGEVIANLEYCPKNISDLENYFNKTIEIQIDDQKLTLKHESCSLEGDAYWFFFSSEAPSAWNSISIKDIHFLELFPTQSNIVKVIDGANEKLIRLNKNNSQVIVKF